MRSHFPNTKAEEIRSYFRVEGFTNREIAALCDASVAYVKTVRTRYNRTSRAASLQRSVSELRERLKATEFRVEQQQRSIAKLLGMGHNENRADNLCGLP